MFEWKCPHCDARNNYSGDKTTNVVVVCGSCKKQVKASSHKIPLKKLAELPPTTESLPNTTKVTISGWGLSDLDKVDIQTALDTHIRTYAKNARNNPGGKNDMEIQRMKKLKKKEILQ